MSPLRRALIPLTLLVLSAGPVCAQQNNPICTANAANPTQVRSTGITELAGDIIVACTGGVALPAGSRIPQIKITVTTTAPITSRILDTGTGASEALLLINEPGNPAMWTPPLPSGYGPSAPQILCSSPMTGCAEYIGYIGSSPVPVLAGVVVPPSVQEAPNMFQGVVNGANQVTFFGVPTAPAVIAVAGNNGQPVLVFRITNIRVNASVASTGYPIFAGVTIDGLPLANPTMTIAMTFSDFQLPNFVGNFPPCGAGSICPLPPLRFTELFASAAKIRLTRDNSGFPGPQNVPGTIYAGSESGFYAPSGGNAVLQTAGLADFGTRLKAVMQAPPGVRVWVATGFASSNRGYTNALLTANERGAFQGVPGTLVLNNTLLTEIPVLNGIATAVWEVVFTNPSAVETFEFPVYVMYAAGTPQSQWVVRGSLAPTSDEGAFPPDGGVARGPSYPIPRFIRPPTGSGGDITPPIITPAVTGTLGNNGWYRSPVTVSWTVSDPESGIASSAGCSSTVLTTDTAGVTLSCTARNGAGIPATFPVTIKIDQTAPVILGLPTSCALWPPNQKLIEVATITASDALSGIAPGTFKVTAISNEPIAPNDPRLADIVITPNATGGFVVRLRADRLGTGKDRVYTVTATAKDLAGNTATKVATCTVPHDERK